MRRPPRLDGVDIVVGLYVEIRHHLSRQWLGCHVVSIRDDDGLVVSYMDDGREVRSGPYYVDRRHNHEVRIPVLELLADIKRQEP